MNVDVSKILKVGDKYYLMPSKEGDPMLALNETCKVILEELGRKNSIEGIVNCICEKYQVDRNIVVEDVNSVVSQLVELGIVSK